MQRSLEVEKRTRRWREQRWLLDSVIKTIGPEWDQARVQSKGSRGGPQGLADFRRAGSRMNKFTDIGPQFGKAGLRREEIASSFEGQGRLVSARDSYLIASLLYASAQWPYFEINQECLQWERRMIETYDKYIEYAGHPVERVDIPFQDTALSAFLHLPHAPADGEQLPCVLHIGGMDGSKENMVSGYGDAALSRGLGVLALDGPGQGETRNRGVTISADNFAAAADTCVAWLAARPEIDAGRIVIRGSSFGTYYGTVAAAGLGDRIVGYCGTGVCQEPGCSTIFNTASPTFKVRFMFMAGYEDEDAFDEFCKEFDLRKVAAGITAPYMIVAGESDQLSPIHHTLSLFDMITAPKRLVLYEDANHSVAQASSSELGENRESLVYDWLRDRVDAKPCVSEKVLVDSAGKMHATPY
ncbi:MAG: alpha/beta hydrolase [Alphaproteobacteria bacterium]|nr:alpha/beta hydrolase [Alphaproteobacteria bacterium]